MRGEPLEIDPPQRCRVTPTVKFEIAPNPFDVRVPGALAESLRLNALADPREDRFGVERRGGPLGRRLHERETGPDVFAANHASENPLEQRARG